MKKKLIGIFVCMLLIASVLSVTGIQTSRVLYTSNVGMSNVDFFIELVELPETLIFDQEHVPEYCCEYRWSIFIDVDNDENTGCDWTFYKGMDVEVAIAKWKFFDSPHEDKIIDGCQENTWVFNNSAWSAVRGIPRSRINVDTESNIISFRCSKDWDEIKEIDNSDRILIVTCYYSEEGYVIDSVSGYGMLSDSHGDVSYDFIDIISGGIVSNEPPLPNIEIDKINGGFRVSADITNNGTASANNVDWSIDLEGGLIIAGEHTEGVISELAPGATTTIRQSTLYGIGMTTITVTAGDATKQATAFILGPLVLGVEEIS